MSISQKEDIYEFLSQAVDTEISRIQQIKENIPAMFQTKPLITLLFMVIL